MKKVRDPENKDLGDIIVQDAPISLSTSYPHLGYASPEAKGVTKLAPQWVAGDFQEVTLDRGEAARLKWVARATRDARAVDLVKPDLHFVRVTGQENGDRIVATDGHRLHFALAPFGLSEPLSLHVPRLGDIKAGTVRLGIHRGDFLNWQNVVALRFAVELAVEAGPLQELAKHGDRVGFVIGNDVHVLAAGLLDNALNDLGPQQRIRVCFNKPTQPVSIKMPERAALIMPISLGDGGKNSVLTALTPGLYAPPQPCNPHGRIPKAADIFAAGWDSIALAPAYKVVKYQDDIAFTASDLYWL
jgi:hypothetical protein